MVHFLKVPVNGNRKTFEHYIILSMNGIYLYFVNKQLYSWPLLGLYVIIMLHPYMYSEVKTHFITQRI